MLLLLYFDRIIGPKVLLQEPDNLVDDLGEDYLEQIKGLLDSSDLGFFTHYFSPELNTANYIFDLNSLWARGRAELIMVTAIISEDEPDIESYRRIMEKFVKKLQEYPNLFKAVYINRGTEEERQNIEENYEILKKEVTNLYKILSIKRIETEGHLYSFPKIREDRIIPLSGDILKRLEGLTNKDHKENVFIVFRTRGEAMKIDVLPIETEKVIRLAIIFGEQMTISILQKISEIITSYEEELQLIFTSGICQEIDRCVYEVYIDTEMPVLDKIIEEIYRIPGVLEIEVKLIALNT
ncbi:MAG: hypothetical protein EU544_02660 [Promethearchaeota archaeon]|nr:MAG: hypothetical protein EU544_02660 [Candidatus Lokiarchaeota archaeon]